MGERATFTAPPGWIEEEFQRTREEQLNEFRRIEELLAQIRGFDLTKSKRKIKRSGILKFM